MTDAEQRRKLDELLFANYDEPWEHTVRGMAATAVTNPHTYRGGTCFPVLLRRGGYQTVRVQLIPELQDHPRHALLIAEDIIREQTGDS